MFLSQYFSFPLSVSFHHCSILIHSFIHLPPTLYNVFLPALQFSPVSNIPPLLHTHPSIYHPRCIMFFSQYFSFPLSVSFHHCSILIHPTPKLYKLSKWQVVKQHTKTTNTQHHKLMYELTCSFPVFSFFRVPFGAAAPFCACCWTVAWRFSAELPRRNTCCEQPVDGDTVTATVDCGNEAPPSSSVLALSTPGFPQSKVAL